MSHLFLLRKLVFNIRFLVGKALRVFSLFNFFAFRFVFGVHIFAFFDVSVVLTRKLQA